jgi:PAS domain S-box-containing protein
MTGEMMNMSDQPELELDKLRAQNKKLSDEHAYLVQALKGSDDALLNQIDEHRAAMEALGHSKTHLRQVIDLVPHAIFAKDANGRYLLVNRAMATACSSSIEEMEDALDTDFFNASVEVERFRAADRAVIATGQRQVIPIETIRFMNGVVRYFNIIKIPFTFGDTPAVLGVATDITEREQARLELAKLNEDLEERVRQRTAELEAANKELESFSYSVSHDLRSPLRGVDGWSLALLEDYGDKLDEQAHGYLNQVRAEIQRMSVLIDDMLKLSRLSRDEMKREAVDCTALATSFADRLQSACPERRVEWRIAHGITTNADLSLLRQVFQNLIENAWKFTAKQDNAVIEFDVTDVDGEKAYFVKDNGAGFDMAYSAKLFGAFQRLHRVADYPGTGVGLATVQRIARRHGGRVWAEGEVGKGATFWFTLGEKV